MVALLPLKLDENYRNVCFQSFDSAIAAIGPRPWLMDNLDEWVMRMKGPPHR